MSLFQKDEMLTSRNAKQQSLRDRIVSRSVQRFLIADGCQALVKNLNIIEFSVPLRNTKYLQSTTQLARNNDDDKFLRDSSSKQTKSTM